MRPGEAIPVGALGVPRGKLEGVEQGVELAQFPNGHSNLTYLLRIGRSSTCCGVRR